MSLDFFNTQDFELFVKTCCFILYFLLNYKSFKRIYPKLHLWKNLLKFDKVYMLTSFQLSKLHIASGANIVVPGVKAKKQTVPFLFSGVPRSTARLSKERKSSSFIFCQSVHGQSNTTPIGSKHIWTLWITSGHSGRTWRRIVTTKYEPHTQRCPLVITSARTHGAPLDLALKCVFCDPLWDCAQHQCEDWQIMAQEQWPRSSRQAPRLCCCFGLFRQSTDEKRMRRPSLLPAAEERDQRSRRGYQRHKLIPGINIWPSAIRSQKKAF